MILQYRYISLLTPSPLKAGGEYEMKTKRREYLTVKWDDLTEDQKSAISANMKHCGVKDNEDKRKFSYMVFTDDNSMRGFSDSGLI